MSYTPDWLTPETGMPFPTDEADALELFQHDGLVYGTAWLLEVGEEDEGDTYRQIAPPLVHAWPDTCAITEWTVTSNVTKHRHTGATTIESAAWILSCHTSEGWGFTSEIVARRYPGMNTESWVQSFRTWGQGWKQVRSKSYIPTAWDSPKTAVVKLNHYRQSILVDYVQKWEHWIGSHAAVPVNQVVRSALDTLIPRLPDIGHPDYAAILESTCRRLETKLPPCVYAMVNLYTISHRTLYNPSMYFNPPRIDLSPSDRRPAL